MGLQVGDRVRVSERHTWARGAAGTIAIPPYIVERLLDERDDVPYQGCRRVVSGRCGPIEFYWIEFDGPQLDSDGDGPYAEAEISADMLERIQEE